MFDRWFPESLSAVASEIDRLFWYSTAWTASVGLIVISILAWFIVRYRQREGRFPFYTHGDTKGPLALTLTLALLVFLLLDVNLAYNDHVVWKAMFGRPPDPARATRIEVMPQQFAWNILYAGPDGLFSTADDVAAINELHVPVDRPVFVQLTSKDVIHSFFLPNLRIKQDAVPGMVTSLYFTPEKTGRYNIACAEHCGLGHYQMKGSFVVDEPAEFDAWLEAQGKESADAAPGEWGWDWNAGLVAGGPHRQKEPTS